MKRIVAVVLLLVFAWLPAHAEVRESDWSTSPVAEGSVAPTVVDNKKAIRPILNITQPELQVRTPRYLLSPTVTPKARSTAKKRRRTARRKPAVSRKKRVRKSKRRLREEKKIAEELWWQDTGNPAVFVFRDCLNYHAGRLRDLAGPVPVNVQIAKAMDVTCRSEFDHMARTIADQFGEDGFRKLSEELLQTTFVPAATVAR